LTLAAGFNGGGFSWAAITGRVVADLVNERDPGFDLATVDPNRFERSGASWSNPFTAGEARNQGGVVLSA
jgi:glycine/D-amino acid oxidase-like deaminating enzyme